jgi:hypothetical protein
MQREMTTTAVAVKERPILFSGAMVRAILDGKKTQTRRMVNRTALQMLHEGFTPGYVAGPGNAAWCPYGSVGDRLWVRETFAIEQGGYGTWLPDANVGTIHYAADGGSPPIEPLQHGFRTGRWRPSIFMPRNVSRIDLELVNVRIERLQDISHEDAIAEGVDVWIDSLPQEQRSGDIRKERLTLKQLAYSYLWDAINEKRGFGWDKNPWVWVVEFKMDGTKASSAGMGPTIGSPEATTV